MPPKVAQFGDAKADTPCVRVIERKNILLTRACTTAPLSVEVGVVLRPLTDKQKLETILVWRLSHCVTF